jgi:hypothetical protein
MSSEMIVGGEVGGGGVFGGVGRGLGGGGGDELDGGGGGGDGGGIRSDGGDISSPLYSGIIFGSCFDNKFFIVLNITKTTSIVE